MHVIDDACACGLSDVDADIDAVRLIRSVAQSAKRVSSINSVSSAGFALQRGDVPLGPLDDRCCKDRD
jgi:hypothetical protein